MKEIIIASFIAGLMVVSFAGVASAAPTPKVPICHIPGGDEAKAKIITFGANAVENHVSNHVGDYIIGEPGTACDAD